MPRAPTPQELKELAPTPLDQLKVPKPEPAVPAQQAAPHLRFVEMSAALQLIETEAVEFLEDGKDIPDRVLLKISAYMLASKAHTDEIVRWLSSARSRIGFLKAEESRVASCRKQGEALLDRVKKYLRKVIDEDPKSSSRLEGNIYHLRTQKNSQARLIYDPEKWKDEIPVEFHQQSITFTFACDKKVFWKLVYRRHPVLLVELTHDGGVEKPQRLDRLCEFTKGASSDFGPLAIGDADQVSGNVRH